MTKIKPGDAAAYRRLLNLLIKYQSLEYGNQNPPDTPGVICLILKKSQGTCKIEDKCKKDQEGPDEITTVNWPDKLHWGWSGTI